MFARPTGSGLFVVFLEFRRLLLLCDEAAAAVRYSWGSGSGGYLGGIFGGNLGGNLGGILGDL